MMSLLNSSRTDQQ